MTHISLDETETRDFCLILRMMGNTQKRIVEDITWQGTKTASTMKGMQPSWFLTLHHFHLPASARGFIIDTG